MSEEILSRGMMAMKELVGIEDADLFFATIATIVDFYAEMYRLTDEDVTSKYMGILLARNGVLKELEKDKGEA